MCRRALCRPCRGWYSSRLQVHGLAPEATFCRPVRGCSAASPEFPGTPCGDKLPEIGCVKMTRGVSSRYSSQFFSCLFGAADSKSPRRFPFEEVPGETEPCIDRRSFFTRFGRFCIHGQWEPQATAGGRTTPATATASAATATRAAPTDHWPAGHWIANGDRLDLADPSAFVFENAAERQSVHRDSKLQSQKPISQ
jgi:hypothetical protein